MACNRKDVRKMMIKRLYRQHTSTVLTLPKPILHAAGIKAGDYVEIEVEKSSQEIRVNKVKERKKDVE